MLQLRPCEVRVLSLSAPAHRDLVQKASQYAASSGFSLVFDPDPSAAYGSKKYLFSTAPAEVRAAALTGALNEKDDVLLLSLRGGYGLGEVLPLVSPGAFEGRTKTLMGYSDFTLLLIRASELGHDAWHGPSFTSLANPEGRADFEDFLSHISGEQPVLGRGFRAEAFKVGTELRLVGGNLSALTSLVGTPYLPKMKGKTLFIEESGEKPYRIHRMLLQLKQAGALEGLHGVLVGSLEGCVHEKGQGPTAEECIRDVFRDIPLQFDFPAGHGARNSPIPFGRKIVVNKRHELELADVIKTQ